MINSSSFFFHFFFLSIFKICSNVVCIISHDRMFPAKKVGKFAHVYIMDFFVDEEKYYGPTIYIKIKNTR